MNILSLDHVSKRFGNTTVIRDLSFEVPEHTIYGFIGQNGAGKTTTMKMILGLLRMDEGDIRVLGEPVRYGQNKTNKYIGYLPDVPEFYGFMTPPEYLSLCGEISGMSKKDIAAKSEELLSMVGLEHNRKRIHGFSRGMKQRLGIAQALLNNPKLLICDEPTSALDPVGRKEILDILLKVKDTTTVLFSTHILSDVERICDEIGLLHEGTLKLHGTIEEIQRMRKSEGFDIEFRSPEKTDWFRNHFSGGERIGKTQLFYPGMQEKELGRAMELLVKQEISPLKLEMREPTLESLFMEVIGQ